jgi:hypothetical protein
MISMVCCNHESVTCQILHKGRDDCIERRRQVSYADALCPMPNIRINQVDKPGYPGQYPNPNELSRYILRMRGAETSDQFDYDINMATDLVSPS